MKKLLLLLLVVGSLTISACAPKTTYIEIQQPTDIWMRGKAIYTAQPGDILRVVESKICRSGKGTCWWVKNDLKGYGGIVSADEMEILHRVYESEDINDNVNQEGSLNINKNDVELGKYSNNEIGIHFQYPINWKLYDDQEKIKDSKLSFITEEIDSAYIIFISPSDEYQFNYDLDSFERPVIAIIYVELPFDSSVSIRSITDGYGQYKASLYSKSGGLVNGPSTVEINGKKWLFVSARIKPVNGFAKSYTHVSNNAKLFEVSAMCKLDEADNYVYYFDKIIESIKLTEN